MPDCDDEKQQSPPSHSSRVGRVWPASPPLSPNASPLFSSSALAPQPPAASSASPVEELQEQEPIHRRLESMELNMRMERRRRSEFTTEFEHRLQAVEGQLSQVVEQTNRLTETMARQDRTVRPLSMLRRRATSRSQRPKRSQRTRRTSSSQRPPSGFNGGTFCRPFSAS